MLLDNQQEICPRCKCKLTKQDFSTITLKCDWCGWDNLMTYPAPLRNNSYSYGLVSINP